MKKNILFLLLIFPTILSAQTGPDFNLTPITSLRSLHQGDTLWFNGTYDTYFVSNEKNYTIAQVELFVKGDYGYKRTKTVFDHNEGIGLPIGEFQNFITIPYDFPLFDGQTGVTYTYQSGELNFNYDYQYNISVYSRPCISYYKGDTSIFIVQSTDSLADKVYLASEDRFKTTKGCDSIIQYFSHFIFTNNKPVKTVELFDTINVTKEEWIQIPVLRYDTAYFTHYDSIIVNTADSIVIADELEIILDYFELGANKERIVALWRGPDEYLNIDTDLDRNSNSNHFANYTIEIVSDLGRTLFSRNIYKNGTFFQVKLSEFDHSGNYNIYIKNGNSVVQKRVIIVRR